MGGWRSGTVSGVAWGPGHHRYAGQVFAPSSQTWLPARKRQSDKWPAIAFGHSWLADSGRYRDLLYHLASWGSSAAPDAERGCWPRYGAGGVVTVGAGCGLVCAAGVRGGEGRPRAGRVCR